MAVAFAQPSVSEGKAARRACPERSRMGRSRSGDRAEEARYEADGATKSRSCLRKTTMDDSW